MSDFPQKSSFFNKKVAISLFFQRFLQQNVEKQLKLPAGYSIKYGGTFENLQQAKSRLAIAVPVSLFLILLILS